MELSETEGSEPSICSFPSREKICLEYDTKQHNVASTRLGTRVLTKRVLTATVTASSASSQVAPAGFSPKGKRGTSYEIGPRCQWTGEGEFGK
jgi:hypothetical protein